MNSIEGRYPFLGNSVVDMALRTDDSAKVVDFEGKSCLKSAYEGIIQESVLRRGKHGFTAYRLRSVTDSRTWDDWRGLVEASGILARDCLDTATQPDSPDKWDFNVSAISIAMVMDELALGL
jgi:asparagine synthase (glutamine-hydrolysing)